MTIREYVKDYPLRGAVEGCMLSALLTIVVVGLILGSLITVAFAGISLLFCAGVTACGIARS